MKNLFLALMLVCALVTVEAQISGKCIRVVDGDTYIFVTSKKDTLKVRDAYINTPEPKNAACSVAQPYSDKSSFVANTILLNRTFKIKVLGEDVYGRTLAWAKLDDIGYYHKYMIKNGYAWSYKQSGVNYKLQQEAKDKAFGLWLNKDAVNPTEWLKKYSTHKKK